MARSKTLAKQPKKPTTPRAAKPKKAGSTKASPSLSSESHDAVIDALKKVLPVIVDVEDKTLEMTRRHTIELDGEPKLAKTGLSLRLRLGLSLLIDGTETPPRVHTINGIAFTNKHLESNKHCLVAIDGWPDALRQQLAETSSIDPIRILKQSYSRAESVRTPLVERLTSLLPLKLVGHFAEGVTQVDISLKAEPEVVKSGLSAPLVVRSSMHFKSDDTIEADGSVLLFTSKQLQNEALCLDALTHWERGIRGNLAQNTPFRVIPDVVTMLESDVLCTPLRLPFLKQEVTLAYKKWSAKQPDKSVQWLSTLRSELDTTIAKFPSVHERFKRAWGLRLPWHLAAFVAFHNAVEKVYSYDRDLVPHGVSHWFDDRNAAKGNPKKDFATLIDKRYPRDPPECVTVASGSVDSTHWRFWYTDPAELPIGVTLDANAGPPEVCSGLTMLDALRQHLTVDPHFEIDLSPDSYVLKNRHLLELLNDVVDTETELLARDGLERTHSGSLYRELGVIRAPLPKNATTLIPSRPTSADEVYQVYEKSPSTVDRWIKYAKLRLASGDVGPAWILGHEMLAYDRERGSARMLDLLVAAYKGLNQPEFEKIAKAHSARWRQ